MGAGGGLQGVVVQVTSSAVAGDSLCRIPIVRICGACLLLLILITGGLLPSAVYAIGGEVGARAELSVRKEAGAVKMLRDGTFLVPFRIHIRNTGTEKLYDVQIEDAVAFNMRPAVVVSVGHVSCSGSCANIERTFDGMDNDRLFEPGYYLHAGESAVVGFELIFDAEGYAGPFENQARGWANDRSGARVDGVCFDSVGVKDQECQSALVVLPASPAIIGLAKEMDDPVWVGDGTFETRIRFVVENFGHAMLENVQIKDDLREVFGDSPFAIVKNSIVGVGLEPDLSFDGVNRLALLAPGSNLLSSEIGSVSLRIRFSPTEQTGVLSNQAVASADGTLDQSTQGEDPDPNGDGMPDERQITTSQWQFPSPEPLISVGLAHAASPTSPSPDGLFKVTLGYHAENFGERSLTDLRIISDLAQTFSGDAHFEVVEGSLTGNVATNPDFDGVSQTNLLGAGVSLDSGQNLALSLDVLFDPGSATSPFLSQALVSATDPATGREVSDQSTRGDDPDPNRDDDPLENLPTPIAFERLESGLSLTKSVESIALDEEGFEIGFHLQLVNSGALDLANVQVLDELEVAFPEPVAVTVRGMPDVTGALSASNPGFGPADPRLLSGSETLAAGSIASIRFSVFIELNGAQGPFFNQAAVTGIDPDGGTVVDLSDSDEEGDGEGGDDDSTSIDLPAGLSLTVLRDIDHDRLAGEQDPPVEGWWVELQNEEGMEVALLRTSPTGLAALQDLSPGNYRLLVRNPDNDVIWSEQQLTLNAGAQPDVIQMVDPSGTVYASDSRMPLPGVTVSLVDERGTPLPDSCLLSGQQSQTTDARGEYRFDLQDDCASAGTVRIAIESVPEGFVAGPSEVIAPVAEDLVLVECAPAAGLPCLVQPQNDPPGTEVSAAYYLGLRWEPDDEGIGNNHLPVDRMAPVPEPDGDGLVIGHEVDRRRATVGDVVGYMSRVQNLSRETVIDVILAQEPPAGFVPVDDSLVLIDPGDDGRFDTVDDIVEPIPAPPGRRLEVFIGDLPAGAERRVRYAARVTPAVVPGIKISKATGLVSAQAADSASASLLIESDPLMAETTVIGKVFHDLNGNGIQDPPVPAGTDGPGRPGEPGIPGVRLVTLDGQVVETDKHGRYHVAAVDSGRFDRGGNFMIKLDDRSLPENRIALAGLRQVVRLTPGLMTRINFPVRTTRHDKEVSARDNRTDPFRIEPKLDILALDPLPRSEEGEGVDVRFAIYSNYHHYIRRYEISFFDVTDSRFPRQIWPDLEASSGTLSRQDREWLLIGGWLQDRPGQVIEVRKANTDIFEQSIELKLPAEVDRIAYRVTAYGECDPANGEPMDRTGLRILDVTEAPLLGPVREAREIFGHSNLVMQNIPVYGERNLTMRHFTSDPENPVAGRTLNPSPSPSLAVRIQPLPLPGDGALSEAVLKASYGLVSPGEVRESIRALELSEEETWAVFDHEGLGPVYDDDMLRLEQKGFVEFDAERIVEVAEPADGSEDERARDVHRVTLKCGCSEMSAQTVISANREGLSLRLTNLGARPERPELRLVNDETSSRTNLLAGMPEGRSQEVFLGRFGPEGYLVENWEKATVEFGLADDRGEKPRFELTRRLRAGEYAPELKAFCAGVTARPHTTKEENLLASIIVEETRKPPLPDPTEEAFFAMGLLNLTLGANDVSGYVEALADDDRFDESVFVDGRIAGYVKGKILGKYLITAQLDTTETALKNLGEGLTAKDPSHVFRQLDPDRYYPVYGDDSTTFNDVNSQGGLYLRVDWDKSQALWGNYNTGLTDTEFSQFNRSLYGAKLDYRSRQTNVYGEDTFALKVFGSEAQTASAHATYRATGGSLYYLPHRDIVQGSEKLWIEIRARDSEQVLDTELLLPGRDYEVDDIQGRIILARPLAHIVRERANTIIRSASLEGDRVYLQVDYEHVPIDFAGGDLTTGARAKWSGDRLSVGVSSVTEERVGADYELLGTDLTWRFGARSFVRGEFARTEASQNDLQAASGDGGLTFTDEQVGSPGTDGDAWGVEMRLDLAEIHQSAIRARGGSLEQLIDARVAGEIRAWHKQKDAGFSSGRLGEAGRFKDTGVSFDQRVNQRFALGGSAVRVERSDRRQTIVRVQSEMQFQCDRSRCTRFEVEGRYEDFDATDEALPGRRGEALLAGARLGRELRGGTSLYGSVQTALTADADYEDNDRFVLGVNQTMTERLAVSLEGSDGDRGEALVGGVEYVAAGGGAVNLSGGIGSGATTQFGTRYTVAEGHEVYGTHTIDPDRTDGARNLTTLGQRNKLGDRTSLFTETTFGRERNYADTAHVFGLNYDLDEKWLLSASVQSSVLEREDGEIERQVFSFGSSYRAGRDCSPVDGRCTAGRRLASRLEYRRDAGESQDTRQYLTSTRFGLGDVDGNGRWLGKLNLAWTDHRGSTLEDGRFVELDVGYAFRPWQNDRWNALSRYSFLYDLGSNGQLGADGLAGVDLEEKSHVLSAEVLHEFPSGFELGGKVTGKFGRQKLGIDGDWYDTRLGFAAVRGRYRLPGATPGVMDSHWELLAEYRLLKDFEEGGTRHGVLTGLYYSIQNGQMKIGAGYNFTDFDSDLKGTGYSSGGWFVDLVAAY